MRVSARSYLIAGVSLASAGLIVGGSNTPSLDANRADTAVAPMAATTPAPRVDAPAVLVPPESAAAAFVAPAPQPGVSAQIAVPDVGGLDPEEGRPGIQLSLLTGTPNLGYGNEGLFNAGVNNTGNFTIGGDNDGDFNIGTGNVGDFNIGYDNDGDFNIGGDNVGDFNVGFDNTGGERNFGAGNSGSYNLGFFNTGDYTVGAFDIGIRYAGANPGLSTGRAATPDEDERESTTRVTRNSLSGNDSDSATGTGDVQATGTRADRKPATEKAAEDDRAADAETAARSSAGSTDGGDDDA